MKKAYAVVGLILVAIVGIRYALAVFAAPDDKTLIQESLRQAIAASREGKAGGVLESLSNSLTVNENSARGNFGRVAEFIRKQKPDVTVQNQNPIITGDEARITSPISIQMSIPMLGEQNIPLSEVVMVFKKENAYEWFIIPTKKWRLVEVSAPSLDPSAFSIGSFGM